jgi:hypothetical protein
MIKGLTGSRYVSVGSYTSDSYVYADNPVPNPAKGALRSNSGNFEVWTGAYWQLLTSDYPEIKLTDEAEMAIQWVYEKMATERRLQQLAQESPAIADALASVTQSLERLEIVLTLTNKETT